MGRLQAQEPPLCVVKPSLGQTLAGTRKMVLSVVLVKVRRKHSVYLRSLSFFWIPRRRRRTIMQTVITIASGVISHCKLVLRRFPQLFFHLISLLSLNWELLHNFNIGTQHLQKISSNIKSQATHFRSGQQGQQVECY